MDNRNQKSCRDGTSSQYVALALIIFQIKAIIYFVGMDIAHGATSTDVTLEENTGTLSRQCVQSPTDSCIWTQRNRNARQAKDKTNKKEWRQEKKKKNGDLWVRIHLDYWHKATKAISQRNLYGSILAVPHINDDCWSALLECSNFITSIPNQFSPPDTKKTNNTNLGSSSLSH